jgi:hypothetical protein
MYAKYIVKALFRPKSRHLWRLIYSMWCLRAVTRFKAQGTLDPWVFIRALALTPRALKSPSCVAS